MTGTVQGISLLGQSTAQINRLTAMGRQLDDLQRQIGTQKRYDSLTGFGLAAQGVLQLRADAGQIGSYNSNLDSTIQNIKTMSDGVSRAVKTLNDLSSLLQSQPRDAQFDVTLIASEARNALDFLTDISNTNVSGRYLFAGTDSLTAPVADTSALIASFSGEVNAWMAGTNTTPQAIANAGTYSGTGLGLSSSISSAQNLSVRISNATEISYGAIADRSGMQDALRALGLIANLRAPDPATDTPTYDDFSTMVDYALDTLRQASTSLQTTLGGMSGALSLAQNVQETHKIDLNLYNAQIDKAENIDPAEVIAMLQALQTQLSASYEATRIASQLSLANFLS